MTVTVHDIGKRMAAFDALPEALRRRIAEAPVPLPPEQIEMIFRKRGLRFALAFCNLVESEMRAA